MDSFNNGAGHYTKALKDLASESERILSTAKSHRDALEKELESSRQSLGELYRTLVGLSKTIIEKVNE